MTFDDYQKQSQVTAMYPSLGHNMVYPALKCAGEAGELADKIGKHWRNTFEKFGPLSMSDATITTEERTEIVKEMGDILWYLAALSNELGVGLDEVAVVNIAKILDRKRRGVVFSQGDNR